MPSLPGISQKEAVRVFLKLGYRVVRESGHLIMSNGERRLVIPRHDPYQRHHHGRDCPRCRSDASAVPGAALKQEAEQLAVGAADPGGVDAGDGVGGLRGQRVRRGRLVTSMAAATFCCT